MICPAFDELFNVLSERSYLQMSGLFLKALNMSSQLEMKQTQERHWLHLIIPLFDHFLHDLPSEVVTHINNIIKRHREITEFLLY